MVNVVCDALAAIIIEKMSKDELQLMNQRQQEENLELSPMNKAEL